MADPQSSYPESATNGARKASVGDGREAVDHAVAGQGERIAALLERSDEAEAALETAILVLASLDDREVGALTDSAGNLVAAADGLTTDGAAALAGDLGEHAEPLADTLETVVGLQEEGHLDDLVALATAFSGSLSTDERESLEAMLAEDGGELVATLESLVELQREGDLDELVATAKTLSALDLEDDAVAGLNAVLGAVGEASRGSTPVGVVGLLGGLTGRDARAGLGYLLAVLRSLGRRLNP
jgi:uncharacterized protein YjgD (DUF1641 family)